MSLPPHWISSFDKEKCKIQYTHKLSGATQYTFPKPGDECKSSEQGNSQQPLQQIGNHLSNSTNTSTSNSHTFNPILHNPTPTSSNSGVSQLNTMPNVSLPNPQTPDLNHQPTILHRTGHQNSSSEQQLLLQPFNPSFPHGNSLHRPMTPVQQIGQTCASQSYPISSIKSTHCPGSTAQFQQVSLASAPPYIQNYNSPSAMALPNTHYSDSVRPSLYQPSPGQQQTVPSGPTSSNSDFPPQLPQMPAGQIGLSSTQHHMNTPVSYPQQMQSPMSAPTYPPGAPTTATVAINQSAYSTQAQPNTQHTAYSYPPNPPQQSTHFYPPIAPTPSTDIYTPQNQAQRPHSPHPLPHQPTHTQSQEGIGTSVKRFLKNNKGKLIAGASVGGAILAGLVGADVSGFGDFGGCTTGGEELVVSDPGSGAGATDSLGTTNEVPVQGYGYEGPIWDNGTDVGMGMQDSGMMAPQDQQVQMTQNMWDANLQNAQWGNDLTNSI